MDGRKNNKGKIGNNGGRKTKAEELKVSAYALSAIERKYGTIDQFWDHIAEQSFNSKEHLKHLLEYAYGRPAQQVDVTTDGQPMPIPRIIMPKLDDE